MKPYPRSGQTFWGTRRERVDSHRHGVRCVVSVTARHLQPRNVAEIGNWPRGLEAIDEGRKGLSVMPHDRASRRHGGHIDSRHLAEEIVAHEPLNDGKSRRE